MRAFVRLSNMSIAKRVVYFGLFSILGLTAVGSIYTLQEWQIETSSKRAAEARIDVEFSETLQTTALQLMRAQSDFLATNDERYIGRFADTMRATGVNIDQLASRLKDDTQKGQVVNEVQAALAAYGSTFQQAVDARKQLGLYPASGLNGRLLAVAKTIDTQFAATPDAGVSLAYQTALALARDGMGQRTPQSIANFGRKVEDLKLALSQSPLPEAAKATFGKAFAEFADASNGWFAADKAQRAAGLTLAGEVRDLDPKIDSLVADIRTGESAAATAEINIRAAARKHFVATFASIVLVTVALSWIIGRGISRPITRITGVMTAVATGKGVAGIPYAHLKNEFGAMARALGVFSSNLAETERLRREQQEQDQIVTQRRFAERERLADAFQSSMGTLADQFARSSSELAEAAKELLSATEVTTGKAASVAGAAGLASKNVQTVAAGAEELSASIREINAQVLKSADIARDAAEEAAKSEDNVRALTSAATRIGDVVNLIKAIAAQTNLLALNATIEAARAGTAGKGFAVVASEVKQLASQTASATDEIAATIGEIQEATDETVAAIGRINKTITMIQSVTATIAGAVEEQGAATGEIAENTQRAAEGTEAVTGNIADVRAAAEATGKASSHLLELSASLETQSSALQTDVADFVRNLRTA